MQYIHFTDETDAKAIMDSGVLLPSSMIEGAIFAVAVGAPHMPGVQQTKMGRPKNRKVAILFSSNFLPDVAYPEEVMWHMDRLPIKDAKVIPAEEAITMLNGSLPVDRSTDKLKIPVHPSVVDKKTLLRTRLPENISKGKILQAVHHLETERRKKVFGA